MRRAVRDYKYEINEGRMTDECIQYLTQLQKDWERHRVKLGVEALRREVSKTLHQWSLTFTSFVRFPNEIVTAKEVYLRISMTRVPSKHHLSLRKRAPRIVLISCSTSLIIHLGSL